MSTSNIRYISPVVTARTITQAEKDASAERRALQRKRRAMSKTVA